MTRDPYHIPPVFVEAEAEAPPPPGCFSKHPVERIRPGDLILLGGDVWRVKAVQTHGAGKRRSLTLYPVLGGRPATEVFFSREWIRCARGG